MKKLLQIVIIISVINNFVYAQDLKIGLKSGIGIYSMSSLKTINDVMPQFLSFDTKLVSNFPPYFYYQTAFLMRYKAYSIGLMYSFQSTGSRISAKDYSGEYRFDMKVKSHTPGIINEFNIFSKNKFKFSIYSTIGLSFTRLEINESLNLLDSSVFNGIVKFKSLNYFCEPGINITYPFMSYLSIGINVGYYLQFGNQTFYEENNKENYLLSPKDRKPIKPEWNGLRFGLTILYAIKKGAG